MAVKICSSCHAEKPLTEFSHSSYRGKTAISSKCKPCAREYRKKVYAANPEKYREIARKSRVRNWEKIRAKRKANVEKYVEEKVRRYGLSASEFQEMLNRQGGVCAICGSTDQRGRALSVDHNHQTGAVRSLLCNNCNTGLGYFKDSPRLMRLAAAYIEHHQQEEADALDEKQEAVVG